jgi:hypothetical protein
VASPNLLKYMLHGFFFWRGPLGTCLSTSQDKDPERRGFPLVWCLGPESFLVFKPENVAVTRPFPFHLLVFYSMKADVLLFNRLILVMQGLNDVVVHFVHSWNGSWNNYRSWGAVDMHFTCWSDYWRRLRLDLHSWCLNWWREGRFTLYKLLVLIFCKEKDRG